MPNVKKLIEKMKQQPNGMRPEEIDKVLAAYGYIPARQKGSHKHYLNKETGDLITIKQENPLKKNPQGLWIKADLGHGVELMWSLMV